MVLLPMLLFVAFSNVLITKTTLANPLPDNDEASNVTTSHEGTTTSFKANTLEISFSSPNLDVVAATGMTEAGGSPASEEAQSATSPESAFMQELTVPVSEAADGDGTTQTATLPAISNAGSDKDTAREAGVDGDVQQTSPLPATDSEGSSALPQPQPSTLGPSQTNSTQLPSSISSSNSSSSNNTATPTTASPGESIEVLLMASLIPVGGVFVLVLFVAVICTAARRRSRGRSRRR